MLDYECKCKWGGAGCTTDSTPLRFKYIFYSVKQIIGLKKIYIFKLNLNIKEIFPTQTNF